MKIFVLTPIYATLTSTQGTTPVVHYFTREWVKMGHTVIVFHFVASYPRLMYCIGKLFQHRLNTQLGILVPTEKPVDEDYEADGVLIHRRCLSKLIPHSLYKKNQLKRSIDIISEEIKHTGVPDWFVGHWDNPQLEILDALKKLYGRPTCIVLHNNDFDFEKKYSTRGLRMLTDIDVIGFRSPVGQRKFEEKYGKPRRSFLVPSGVSEVFLTEGSKEERTVKQPIRNFVYVGSLIERKYPSAILTALSMAFPDGDFTMTYIGDGAEKNIIEENHRIKGKGRLFFTGRIPREEIIQYLKQSDVFVMISKNEVFGLVYLEAMALGLIPVGSKDEGIDGIIRDGENGFLCEAGNVDELAMVLEKLRGMPADKLAEISTNARETARKYSDVGVAKMYIENLMAIQ